MEFSNIHFCSGGTFFGSLDTNKTYIWPPDISKDMQLKLYKVTYHVTFEAKYCQTCIKGVTKCCPHFVMANWKDYMRFKPNDCYKQMSMMSSPGRFNFYNVPLDENEYSGCVQKGDIMMCKNSMSFGQGEILPVSFTFASCNNSKGLHLQYNVTFQSVKPMCFPNPALDICGYKLAGLPGTIGFNDLKTILKYKQIFKLLVSFLPLGCHKYALASLCRSVMPECDNHTKSPRLIFPCAKECHEIHNLCQKKFEQAGIRFACKMYLNSVNNSLCFYKPVLCPMPSNIQNGKVVYFNYTWNSTANYSCNSVFLSLSGSKTRKCLATGHWDTHSPKCVFNITLICLVSILPFAVFMFIIFFLVYAFGKRRILYQPLKEWIDGLEYDAFITYSSRDSEFVENEFRIKLEEEAEPPFRLCLHHRDFPLGASIIENIEMAITQSVTCIVLVSSESIKSKWCSFEFTFAKNRIVTNGLPPTSLILVFLEDIPINELSPGMQALYYTCTILKRDHKSFWKQIANAIHQAKCDMHVPIDQFQDPPAA